MIAALGNLKRDILVEMKHQINQQLDAHSTTNLVEILYGQMDILNNEVFSAGGTNGKNHLLKIVVTSNTAEAVEGCIQEKKKQKHLTTMKEKECCTTDSDDNYSINNHIINKKGSDSNNNSINYNHNKKITNVSNSK